MLAGAPYWHSANPLYGTTCVFDVSWSGFSARLGGRAMRKSRMGYSAGSVSVRTGGRGRAERCLRAAACMEVAELESRVMFCAEHNLPGFGDDIGFSSVIYGPVVYGDAPATGTNP